MGLKWYCVHRGTAADCYQHPIYVKAFPLMVEVDIQRHDHQTLHEWLDAMGLCYFTGDDSHLVTNDHMRTFYFNDARLARIMRLVWQ